MGTLSYTKLENRGVIRISGPERVDFLQGLVSGDVRKVSPNRAIWSAFLSPQGKYLHDFFIAGDETSLWLDCELERMDGFFKKLSMYRLKADVELSDESANVCVFAAPGAGAAAAMNIEAMNAENGAARAFDGGVVFADPRHPQMGVRLVAGEKQGREMMERAGIGEGTIDDYERVRISLGLPDASHDMDVDRALLLENGFAELGGVSFEKGCYIGQEVTARTHYRGLVKKRLLPVEISGPTPEPGTAINMGGREVGEMKTSIGNIGLALLRLECLEDDAGELSAGAATLVAKVPDWAVIRMPGDGADGN